ncbi:unnamed protein product [Cylindrotheca closterium]|uniref:Uncharacterized protein n=1 Tax=Cylindrotheca closterium TaxID=2856 RepID=A0AAD2FFQ3_9STRA|nr:unnamed protein product [Cylindrotheca closterium]
MTNNKYKSARKQKITRKTKSTIREPASNDDADSSSTANNDTNTLSMFGLGTSVLPPTGSLMSSIFGKNSGPQSSSKPAATMTKTSIGSDPPQANKQQSTSLMSSIFGNGDNNDNNESEKSSIPREEDHPSPPSKRKRKKKDDNRKNDTNDDAVKANTTGIDLFSSSASFQQVSQKRQEEIRKKQRKIMQKQVNQSRGIVSLSPNAVLERRRKRTATTGDLVTSVTVDVQQYCEPSKSSEDSEEDYDDDMEGVARLLVGRSSALFRQQGVIILQSLLSQTSKATTKKNKKSKSSASSLMKQMQSKARDVEFQVCQRLNEKLGEDSYRPKSSSSSSQPNELIAKKKDRSFRFVEVASRCLGRLDIRYGMDETPFTNLHLPPSSLPQDSTSSSSNGMHDNNVVKLLWPLVQDLLGKDAELVYTGLIPSFPGSEDQPWHQDGTTLFPDMPSDLTNILPPYALNVFIPLLDVTEELGPTEFWLGSHATDQAQDFLSQQQGLGRDPDDDDDENNDDSDTKPQIIGPLLSVGDALIYDYRICHRGTSNLSKTKTTRPMLYLMFARPWFKEHLNFGNEHLFDCK